MPSKVVTDLIANDKTTGPVKAAEKAVRDYAAKAGAGLQTLAKRYLQIGAAAAAGLAYVAKSQIEQIGASARAAQQLSMSIQTYQTYQSAAKAAGLESQMFGEQLAKFTGKIGQARGGSAELASAFAAIGVSMADLQGKSPDEVFRKTLDGLKSIQDPASRSAAAIRIFGEEGLKMGALFAQGSAGLDAAGKRLNALGGGLTQLDASKALAANAALKDMGTALEIAARKMAVALAPAAEKIADIITMTTVAFSKLTSAQKSGAVQAAAWVGGIAAAIVIIPKVWGAIKTLITFYKGLITSQVVLNALSGPKGWIQLAAGLAIAAAALGALSIAYDSLADAAGDAMSETRAEANAHERNAAAIRGVSQALDEQTQKRREAAQAVVKRLTAGVLDDPSIAYKKEQGQFERDAGISGEAGRRIKDAYAAELKKKYFDIDPSAGEAFQRQLIRLESALDSGAISQEEFARATGKLREAFGADVLTPMEKFREALKLQDEALENGAVSVEQYAKRRKAALDAAFGEREKTPGEKYAEAAGGLKAGYYGGAFGRGEGAMDEYSARRQQAQKEAFGESRTPIENLAKRLADLAPLAKIDPQQYGRLAKEARESTPGYVKSPAEAYRDRLKELSGLQFVDPKQFQRQTAEAAKSFRDASGASQWMTPKEKLQEEKDRLKELYQGGGLDKENYLRGLAAAQEQYGKKRPEFQASFEGIQDTFKRIQASRASTGEDKQQKALDYAKANVDAAKEIGATLQDIYRWWQKNDKEQATFA